MVRRLSKQTRTHRSSYTTLAFVLLLAVALVSGCGSLPWQNPIDKINHVIIIYQENWSFDGLYGKFPGANGIFNAGETARQVDKDGKPYDTLPVPSNASGGGNEPSLPEGLDNGPFDLSQYIAPDQKTWDLIHRFYQEQLQINGGKMDKFVAWSNAGALTMGYYDATNFPVGQFAQQYTLADNFFHAAFGGSFLNHIFLICACVPVWPDAPADLVAKLDDKGNLVKDGAVTSDGFAVNTLYPSTTPRPENPDPKELLPLQGMPTIGDRLSEKGVSWAWFAAGWNDAVNGKSDPTFEYHHQPFLYFANYAVGTPGRAEHLKDMDDFRAALRNNALPAVSFIKPLGLFDEHPGYTDVMRGQNYIHDLIKLIQASPAWKDSAIILAYDENGGRWDHVAPPKGDRWGPGTRVPAIIISPFAKRHWVDHTQYDTTSILKFIETRWELAPLGSRDAAANDLTNAFDFSQSSP
jgi:phospholipase C